MHNNPLSQRTLALITSCTLLLTMLPVPARADELMDEKPEAVAIIEYAAEGEDAGTSDAVEDPLDDAEDPSNDEDIEESPEEVAGEQEPEAETQEEPAELAELSTNTPEVEELEVAYQTHVQNVGWQDWASKGKIAGTAGRSLRVEALRISLPEEVDGGISYRAHVQNVGWQDPVNDGEIAGTSGRSLRVEALEINLTGNVATTHDVWYRTHVQNVGWQIWVKNGSLAGTTGRSLRVEAIQILVLPKGSEAPATPDEEDGPNAEVAISYRASLKGFGWQGWMPDGATAGSTSDSMAMDAVSISLAGLSSQDVHVSAHVANVGWDAATDGGEVAGRPATSNAIEALKVWLTGDAADSYDIYYHTYLSGYGWTAWAKNGEATGSTGMALPIQALQVTLVAKGEEAPASDGCQPYVLLEKPTLSVRAHVQNIGWQDWVGEGATAGTSGRSLRVEALQVKVDGALSGQVQIRAHVQNIGWQDWASEGAIAGTSGRSLRVEAFQMRLTGELAEQYDVYYRVHAQNIGWMGWAKNGESAGTEALSLRLEAVQVKVVRKSGAAPGSTSDAYINGKNVTKLGYQNPAGFYQVSSKNVTITGAARAPFNYVTPSRIGIFASRQDCVNAFLARAREYMGTPYVWNYSCAPGVGVDCIGLVYQCAYACGMDLGGGTANNDFNPWAHISTGSNGWHSHDANNFWYYGKAMHVSVGARRPGDVLWWPGHVAIYLGGDSLIEAYTPSTGVIYSSLSSRSYPSGCIRLFQ